MFLISEGSEFHNLGAAIVNDPSAIAAADFFSGEVNNIALLNRRLYLVFYLTCTRLDMYEGALLCSALKVIMMTLNSTL